ncbi:hypothetical protein MTR67_026681 [Solanum verrucosum]|uniref:Integrase zinc-binding domain-containing protein n=1 Tax=Solanum verrucosum TaxID=315347 RepID=A0AAF0R7Q4_SOLVR|nr:hypothetical protein MTR67_026681 [Solanum verrucosum]
MVGSLIGLDCVLMEHEKVISYALRRWIDLLKDYDMSVLYHLDKANVVVDALRRLSMGSVAHIEDDVKAKQDLDPIMVELKKSVSKKAIEAFSQGGDGVLRYQCHLCVPNVDELKNHILVEAHSSWYCIHLGATKIYRDLQEVYWWNGMKKDIAEFKAKFPNCQQVKVEHKKSDV